MFQRHALWGLLLFATVTNIVKAEVLVDEEIDAVIIAAPREGTTRNGRQLPLYPIYPLPIVRVGPAYPGLIFAPQAQIRTTCTTHQNTTGHCMTINECHPTWKVFRTDEQDSWAFGLHNTCVKDGPQGKEVMGVCCPDNKDQQSSFADDSVLESGGERSSGDKKDQKKSTSKATKCLLNDNQKRKIENSRCTTNTRESVAQSNAFIAKNIMPWAGAAQFPQTFLTRHWIKKRAIDLGINRIVGGRPISPHQFKFVAALLTEDYQGRVRQFCGGSVIDEYHILTAAHCVASYTEDDVRRLRVHLGVHNIQNTHTKSVHRVDRIIRHISFSQRTLDNDVAILTLNTPAPFRSNTNVKQACLPSDDTTFEGRSAIVAGWGSLKFGGQQPKELYSVNVKIWNNHNCHSNYGAQAPGGITSRMMCASLPGKDSCQGDSGGALFTCTSSSDCTQIGIVSWGIGCAQAQYPGVYTRVTKMQDWITRITSCY